MPKYPLHMNTSQTLIKNTSVLLLGRVLTTALGFVYVAALSRYIQASGMGKIATATSLVSITSLIMNFGLGQLIVRDIAADKTRSSLYITTLFFIRGCLALVFLISILLILKIVGYTYDMTVIILICCITYIFDEFYAICSSIFNAHEKMEYSAGLQTGRDIINVVLSLAAIALRFNLYVILAISTLANILKLVASLWILTQRISRPALQLDLQLTRSLLLAALPFSIITIAHVATIYVDTFILSLYRSAQEVGWYSPAALLVNYLLLFPSIILQAVFPVFSKFNATSKENLLRAYSASFKFLLIFGSALCFGALVTADQVILLIFGPGFENASLALRILSISFFWVYSLSNGAFLLATGRQTIVTIFEITSMGLVTLVSLLLIPRFGFIGASIAHILPGFIFFFPLTLICHQRVGARVPYGIIAKTVASAVLMSGVVALALDNHLHILVAILVVAPCVYGIALIGLGVIGRQDFDLTSHLISTRLVKEGRE